jgi:hypothetical protein
MIGLKDIIDTVKLDNILKKKQKKTIWLEQNDRNGSETFWPNLGEIFKIGQDSIKSISIYYIFWIEIKYTGYSRWNEIELRTLPRTEQVKKKKKLREGQVVFQHSCQAIQVQVNWILKSMINGFGSPR